jgi:hypothetical protein
MLARLQVWQTPGNSRPDDCQNFAEAVFAGCVALGGAGHVLWEQMGGHDGEEFAGGNHFGFLPELGEVALVAGDEVVGAGGVCAFEEDVVVRVRGDLQQARWCDDMGAVFEELEQLQLKAAADAEFRTRQHGAVFREDGRREVEARGLSDGEEQDGTLQTVGLEGGGNDDVGIENQAKREHDLADPWCYDFELRFADFRFRARAFLMMRSIWRELRAAVPLSFDSAPMAFRTSGSGEAKRM